MSSLGLFFGVWALLGMMVGLVPLLGWLNWLNLPVAFLALLFSGIGLAMADDDRHKTNRAVTGIIFALVAMGVGAVRLMLGSGLF